MRAADGSGDTLGLQEKAPSRGMRYLVKNITNKFHVATRNASSPTRTHTFWNKDAEKRLHHTHPWIYGSRVGAWLGPFNVLQYATEDGCGGQRPGKQQKIEWTRPHACLVHTIKNLHRRRKGHAHPHPSFSIHTGRITTNQASIRSKLDDVVGVQRTACYNSMSACENITSSVNFLFSEKASLSKWSEIRVSRIEKISIVRLKDVVVLTQFSRDVHGG